MSFILPLFRAHFQIPTPLKPTHTKYACTTCILALNSRHFKLQHTPEKRCSRSWNLTHITSQKSVSLQECMPGKQLDSEEMLKLNPEKVLFPQKCFTILTSWKSSVIDVCKELYCCLFISKVISLASIKLSPFQSPCCQFTELKKKMTLTLWVGKALLPKEFSFSRDNSFNVNPDSQCSSLCIFSQKYQRQGSIFTQTPWHQMWGFHFTQQPISNSPIPTECLTIQFWHWLPKARDQTHRFQGSIPQDCPEPQIEVQVWSSRLPTVWLATVDLKYLQPKSEELCFIPWEFLGLKPERQHFK